MVVITSLDGVIALAVWGMQPRVSGMQWIACGFLLLPLALGMNSIDAGVHWISARNVLINLSHLFIAEGMAVFVGRPRLRWAPAATVVLTFAAFELVQWWYPGGIRGRYVLASACIIILVGRGVWLAYNDQGRMGMVRRLMICTLTLHIIFMGARLLLAAFHPDEMFVAKPPFSAWTLFEITLAVNHTFFCMLVMAGGRLAEDLRDRTERLSEEQRLKQSLIEALASERRLRSEQCQFLQMLGHELGTPLAVIGRSAEMVKTLVGDAQHAAATRLNTIVGSTQRLSRMVEGLLTIERAGLDVASFARLDLGDIVRDAVRLTEEEYGAARTMVDIHGRPTWVMGDRDMMITVMINLIGNALKYSPAAAPVHVSVGQRADQATVTVRDRGIGFPDDQMNRIGEKFFRAANAEHLPGNGLGLNIVKVVMDIHGGRLDLSNGTDGGAIAAVSLRACQD